MFLSVFIHPSVSSPLLSSPLLPHSLRPLHLSTPVISPFNFTYLELAADSLKYLAVHFRYALIHRWADRAFVCGVETRPPFWRPRVAKTALIWRRRERAVPGAHGGESGNRNFRLKTVASFKSHIVFWSFIKSVRPWRPHRGDRHTSFNAVDPFTQPGALDSSDIASVTGHRYDNTD